jgi:hypothetical protein
MARANRAFLQQAVRVLAAEAGIRQFLDISTGLPTSNSVHEVAQRIDLSARGLRGQRPALRAVRGRARRVAPV